MASAYDIWKSTDSTWESSADRARCAHVLYRETGEAGPYRYDRPVFCDVPYEEHDDEIMGHEFVMPEPEGRDY